MHEFPLAAHAKTMMALKAVYWGLTDEKDVDIRNRTDCRLNLFSYLNAKNKQPSTIGILIFRWQCLRRFDCFSGSYLEGTEFRDWERRFLGLSNGFGFPDISGRSSFCRIKLPIWGGIPYFWAGPETEKDKHVWSGLEPSNLWKTISCGTVDSHRSCQWNQTTFVIDVRLCGIWVILFLRPQDLFLFFCANFGYLLFRSKFCPWLTPAICWAKIMWLKWCKTWNTPWARCTKLIGTGRVCPCGATATADRMDPWGKAMDGNG